MYYLTTEKIKDAFQFIAETAFDMVALIENVQLQQKNLFTPSLETFQIKQESNEMSYYYKQGCVSERKDGRYIARLYLLGKQRQVASGRNKKEVVERLNKIVDLKNQNKIKSLEDLFHVLNDLPLLNDNEPENSVQTSYTLYSWLDTWLQDYKENKVSNNYFIQLKSNIKVHIKPNIPDCPLTKISALDIQRGLNKIKSSRMRENAYTVLNEAIRKAYVLDFIPKNYMEAVDKEKHNRTPRKAFTQNQQTDFINAAIQTEIGKIFAFQIYSGARPGEAHSMLWEYIDFEKDTCFINGTKNRYAKRTIPLFQRLRELLETIPRTADLIFPYSNKEIRKEFKRLSQLCHLEGYDQYCCRHTFGTRCEEAGIDIKTISVWMGHNDVTTTGKIYIESQDEHQIKMKTKLDEAF